jgi:hypothetical protein
MIQRKEARRRGMAGSQAKSSEEHEAQALTTKTLKPPFKKYQNPIFKDKVAEGDKCTHCKISGHTKKNCWFLHPHLRLISWIKKGEGDQKGERKREEAKRKGLIPRRC